MITTREDIKRATEVMLAYAQGKTIQRQDPNGKWNDCPVPMFDWAGYNYRIKPQLTDIQPNQWISVEDDLPCNHAELCEDDSYTKKVLVTLSWEDDPEKRHIGICRMGNKIGLFDVGWHWQDITYYKVTHWMLLPDLPTD